MHKAFLLGAGLGTRLKPLTLKAPKPLVPVHNQPLAQHTLRSLAKAGITDFAINTHHLPEEWQRTFPAGAFEGHEITFFHEKTLLETGGGIKNIASFIGSDSVLVHNGDILTDLDLGALIAAHRASGNVATLALRSTGDVCNVAIDGDQVVDMRHARGIHPGTHQFTGIYCIEPGILPLIPAGEVVSIVPAFLQLAEQGKLGAHVIPDDVLWLDLGDRTSYLAAHQIDIGTPAIHPDAQIADGATITRSHIGAGAKVGAGAKITESVIWPGSTIEENSCLERCIVYSGAVISGHHSDADL